MGRLDHTVKKIINIISVEEVVRCDALNVDISRTL